MAHNGLFLSRSLCSEIRLPMLSWTFSGFGTGSPEVGQCQNRPSLEWIREKPEGIE